MLFPVIADRGRRGKCLVWTTSNTDRAEYSRRLTIGATGEKKVHSRAKAKVTDFLASPNKILTQKKLKKRLFLLIIIYLEQKQMDCPHIC